MAGRGQLTNQDRVAAVTGRLQRTVGGVEQPRYNRGPTSTPFTVCGESELVPTFGSFHTLQKPTRGNGAEPPTGVYAPL